MTAPERVSVLAEGFFWPAVLALLSAMTALQIGSAMRESQSIDESNQLVTGYAYLKTGQYTRGLEHPPLLKLLFALPLLALNPRLPGNYPAAPMDGGIPSAGLDFCTGIRRRPTRYCSAHVWSRLA